MFHCRDTLSFQKTWAGASPEAWDWPQFKKHTPVLKAAAELKDLAELVPGSQAPSPVASYTAPQPLGHGVSSRLSLLLSGASHSHKTYPAVLTADPHLQALQIHEFMVFWITSVFFSTKEVVYPHTSAYDASLFFYLLYSVNFNKGNVRMPKKHPGSSCFQCTVIPRSQFGAGLSDHHPGSNSIDNLPIPRLGPHTAVSFFFFQVTPALVCLHHAFMFT